MGTGASRADTKTHDLPFTGRNRALSGLETVCPHGIYCWSRSENGASTTPLQDVVCQGDLLQPPAG